VVPEERRPIPIALRREGGPLRSARDPRARLIGRTNATTRPGTASIRPSRGPLIHPGDELASAETALRYRIDRLIGQGGYGQVYTARRLGRSRTVPASLCVKVSRRIDAWIREAYFGQLLADHPRRSRFTTRSWCPPPTGLVHFSVADFASALRAFESAQPFASGALK